MAHQCEVESFTKDGKTEEFYNGPSPDEVALVEFARSRKYICKKNESESIIMEMNQC